MNVEMKIIGKCCQIYRKEIGYTQFDVERETGFSQKTVSAFEKGRDDNCVILLWYFKHGMTISDILNYKRLIERGFTCDN